MLTPQQTRAIEVFLDKGRLLLQADTSFGKTFVFLKIVDELRKKDKNLTAIFITDTRVRDADGLVQQYTQWQEFLPNLTFSDGKIDGVEVFAYSNLKNLSFKSDFLCLDESQKIKDPKTNRFLAIHDYLESVQPKYRLCMSATPIANSLADIWSQMWVVDEGVLLGRSFREFQKNYMTYNAYKKWDNWEFRKGAEADILQQISENILKIDTDRPAEFEEFVISYELDEKNMSIYKTLERDGMIFSEGLTALKVKEVLGKIRQFTFGLMKISKGDKIVNIFTEERVAKKKNTFEINKEVASFRYQKLKEIINKAISHTNVIIFTHYIAESDFLLQNLSIDYPAKNIKRIEGGENKQTFASTINSWNNREINILICNPTSVGTGLNLQYGGHCLIWHTSSFSYITQYQANSRLIRYGQKEKVRIYYLVAKNTIDEAILRSLKNKESLKTILQSK